MEVIDFRGRPSTPEFAASGDSRAYAGLMAAKNRSMPKETPAQFVEAMDRLGISKTVIPARDVETTYGFRVSNDHIRDLVKMYPDRFIGFGAVDPNKGMAAVHEVSRAIEDLGLKGISLDPYLHQKPANHRIYYPVYAKCIELKVPVLMTSGPAIRVPGAVLRDAGPDAVDDVATDLPELTVIISHGMYPYVTEMIALAARHPNVYFEFSGSGTNPGADLYVQAVNDLVGEKAMYASAHPFTDMEQSIVKFREMPFKESVKAAFFSGNAKRILGLAK